MKNTRSGSDRTLLGQGASQKQRPGKPGQFFSVPHLSCWGAADVPRNHPCLRFASPRLRIGVRRKHEGEHGAVAGFVPGRAAKTLRYPVRVRTSDCRNSDERAPTRLLAVSVFGPNRCLSLRSWRSPVRQFSRANDHLNRQFRSRPAGTGSIRGPAEERCRSTCISPTLETASAAGEALRD